MNKEEANDYAKTMSYRDAVYNALQGKCIPYRKATIIKLNELLDMLEPNTIFELIESSKKCRYCVSYKFSDMYSGHCNKYDIDVYKFDHCPHFEGGSDYEGV